MLSLWQKETTYTVPNTVTKLATVSFSGCKLNKLNLPNNLKYIDESAFTETSLKTLSIPESVEYIGRYAFDLSGIETINIPKGITTIEEGTFYRCMQLKSVSIDNHINISEITLFLRVIIFQTLTFQIMLHQ